MQVGFFCSVVVDFCCCCLPPLRGGRFFLIWMGGTKTSVKVLGKKRHVGPTDCFDWFVSNNKNKTKQNADCQ